MTVIQHLLLPSGIVDGAEALYSTAGNASFPLRIEGEVGFLTHFNCFPAGAVKRLAGVSEASFTVRCSGDLKVSVIGVDSGGRTVIPETPVTDGAVIRFPLDHELVGVSFTGKGVLEGGDFSIEKEAKDVHLALCICTYRREDLLRAKVGGILEFIGRDEQLPDRLRVYISDNASSLGEFDSPLVTVMPSPNLGGSGGFTRCIMAAQADGISTHVLLNDDDAMFEPEIIFRTIALLSVCDEICIAGNMLDKWNPDKLIETGASYRRTTLHNIGRNVSVLTDDGNILTSSDKEFTYAGWWFAVYPLSGIGGKGLPLPLFFKMDDAEYGTRLDLHNVTFCGISAWHPSFRSKTAALNSYYYVRNALVTAASAGDLSRDAADYMCTRALLETACMRYDSAEMMIRGIEDFLRGPEHVFNLCREGMIESPDLGFDDLVKLRSEYPETPRPERARFLRKVTLNGALLSPRGNTHVSVTDMRTRDFYRAEYAVFDVDGEKGFVVKMDPAKVKDLTRRILRIRKRMRKELPKISDEYRVSRRYWTSAESWKKFFGE